MSTQAWNSELYQSRHSFVWEYGRELLGMLGARAGERILDVGCGTGNLTAEIARAGAAVVGVDSSAAMIGQARKNFPELAFDVADVCALPFVAEFDAVFSNAVLHWVPDAHLAAAAMARALKPGGRMVLEFGGKGNVGAVLEAVYRGLEAMGVAKPAALSPWYFPSVDEYTSVLEAAGMHVSYAALFDRMTKLEDDGMSNWIRVFGGVFLNAVEEGRRDEFLRLVNELAAPQLLRDGVWYADYRRLRLVAVKG